MYIVGTLRNLRATTTTTGTEATTWVSAACRTCGKPAYYVGDMFTPDFICQCRKGIPFLQSFDDWLQPEEDVWDRLFAESPDVLEKMANEAREAYEQGRMIDIEDMFARAPWECPRCHTVNAPHVNQCTCKGAS